MQYLLMYQTLCLMVANDRIVTGNGSDSMRGESNVTIDSSSNLQIGSGGQLTLTGGTNAVSKP